MNNQIFFFFYNFAHQSQIFDLMVIFFAVCFPYIVILLAGFFLLFHHEIFLSANPFKEFINKWKEFLFLSFSCGSAWIVSLILKNLFHISRPFLTLPDVYPLFIKNTFSFPSEHAMFFSALAVSLFFYHKKAGYVFMFFAFIIGLARIIAGVHFPIDILGGFVLGALVAYSLRNV